MGGATSALIPEDEGIAVIEHHVQLLRPVPVDGERLVCQARVTHDVGDFWITAAEVTDNAGNTVATAGFTSISRARPSEAEATSERVLATILFSDIVGSTQQAQQLGDADWQRVLATHHAIVRRQIEVFRGREVKTTGDGFVVLFDAPARAVQCATAIRRSLRDADIHVRVGLHTGECDLADGDVSGIAVHAAARIEAAASPGEILVSQTVRDLTAGSGLVYEDAGDHELKGLTGPWQLLLRPRVVARPIEEYAMDFGAHLPLMDFGGHPYTLDHLVAYTKAATQLGFSALSANDHMVFSVPWLDGPVALAAALEHSGDMTLATTVALGSRTRTRTGREDDGCDRSPLGRSPGRGRRSGFFARRLRGRRSRFRGTVATVRRGDRCAPCAVAPRRRAVRRPFLFDRGHRVGTPAGPTARTADLGRQLGLRRRTAARRPPGRRLAGIGLQHDAGAVRSSVAIPPVAAA